MGNGRVDFVPFLYDCCFYLQVLRLMVGVQVTEEQLESITDRTVQEADEDGDGAVSFLEFTKVGCFYLLRTWGGGSRFPGVMSRRHKIEEEQKNKVFPGKDGALGSV